MQHSDSKQRRHKVIPLLCKNFKWKYRPPINSMTESAVTYKCDRVKKEGGRQTDRQTPGKVCRATIVDGTNVSDSVSPVSSLTLLWLNHWITECTGARLHFTDPLLGRPGDSAIFSFSIFIFQLCSTAYDLLLVKLTLLYYYHSMGRTTFVLFVPQLCGLYSCTTSFRQLRP
jgi:hypothetical protein